MDVNMNAEQPLEPSGPMEQVETVEPLEPPMEAPVQEGLVSPRVDCDRT